MGRYVRFLIAVALGVAGGLYYGWVASPVEYVDTSPDTLREDYKTDYVLMVAEAYAVEADLALAVRRLAILGDSPPFEIASRGVAFAEQIGYGQGDIELLKALQADLKTWDPILELSNP